jgi:hypothetical protein
MHESQEKIGRFGSFVTNPSFLLVGQSNFHGVEGNLNPPSKKIRTSLVLINRDDRMSSGNQSITNEVKALWHKAFCRTSTRKREAMGG